MQQESIRYRKYPCGKWHDLFEMRLTHIDDYIPWHEGEPPPFPVFHSHDDDPRKCEQRDELLDILIALDDPSVQGDELMSFIGQLRQFDIDSCDSYWVCSDGNTIK